MKQAFAAFAATTALIAAPGAQAQNEAPRTFTQEGQWTLDFGEDYCRLAGVFTDGSDEISLALERNRADNVARLILVGDAIDTYRRAETIEYRYFPDGEERMAGYISSETAEGAPYYNLGLIAFGPDPFGTAPGAEDGQEAPPRPGDGEFAIPPYDRQAESEFAAGVTGIALEGGVVDPVHIRTGPMKAPVEALQTCMDDLLVSWGLDYEKHRNMTRRAAPEGPAHEWLPGNAIGFDDFASFAGARNPVRVMVDAQGNPTECHVHWPSLGDRKNERICSGIMENGSFVPALDGEGEAMASYWTVDPAFGLVPPPPG